MPAFTSRHASGDQSSRFGNAAETLPGVSCSGRLGPRTQPPPGSSDPRAIKPPRFLRIVPNYIDSNGRAPRGATCPDGLDCEYNSHAAVQSKLGAYRQEWGPVSSFAWPITMLLLHKQFAKYDYWTEFGPEGQYEIEPGDWGHSGDLGNYLAGYGAAFGPPIAASGCAALAVHAAG